MLSAALWIGALAAAVLAVVQLSRQSTRLRDELEEVRTSLKPAPEIASRARGGSGPIFGGLYEEKPSAFESLAAWPGVLPACAAAVLLCAAAFTNRPAHPGQVAADSSTTAQLAAVRLQYDSLAKKLAGMHDSLVLQHVTSASTASPSSGAAVTTRKPAAAAPTRRTSAPAAPAVAPLPAMPKVTP